MRSGNETRDDFGLKTVAAHVVTALVTLALAALWLGRANRGPKPEPVLNQIARRSGGDASSGTISHPYVLPAKPPSISADVLKRSDADEQINIRVYEAVNRGVVNITSSAEGLGIFGDESTSGSGSGFVLDHQGNILTNYHVVEGAESLQVTLYDGSTVNADPVGLDPSNDVAVVRVHVPSEKLVPLALGDSSKLVVGQKVLAVGNPFGLERTLTTGIISSLDRSMHHKNGRLIKGIIQTDAAINPGNSGGPLLNSRGEVIGMTTAIISQVGQSAGIGFAVPINTISRILKPLIEHGRVIRADLGLRRVLVTDAGLLMRDIVEGGPADRAGIRPIQVHAERIRPYIRRYLDPESADLIVAIDGKPVRSFDDLLTEVEAHAPGQTVILTVIREGKSRKVNVVLGQS